MPHLRARLQRSLGDKYRIIRELTGGGMSRVFLAEDTELEREVAVKVLTPELVDDTLLQRFRQEVLQTARLQHPTIVPMLGAGTIDDGDGRTIPYYVMQYVRGESLRSRLLHEGQMSVSLSIRILRGILDALVHAHAHDVVHRDIKPENVFMSGTSVVLADFGVAKAAGLGGHKATITSPGTTVGTPTYMAPEQLVGEDETNQCSDLFSCGVVAYEMLAGRLPWDGRTPNEVMVSKARNQITPLRSIRPDVPATLEAMIMSCLSWDQEARPRSAMVMLGVVEALGMTPVTPTSLPTGSLPGQRWRLRRRALQVAAAVVIVGALGVVGWRKWLSPGMRTNPVQLAVLYPVLDAPNDTNTTLQEQLYHQLVSSLRPVSGLLIHGEVSVPEMAHRGLTARQIADSLQVDSMLVIDAHAATGGSYQLSIELRRATKSQPIVLAGPIRLQSLNGLTPDSLQTLITLLSGEVVARLGLVSSNTEVATTRLIDAWVAWSNGRDAYALRTPAGIRTAITNFERAIALDSTYSQAHADLGSAYALSLWYHYRRDIPPYVVAARSLQEGDRAVALQPGLGDGYLVRAYLGGLAGAPVSFLRDNYTAAGRLKSTNPNTKLWSLNLLAAERRYQDALPSIKDQVRADPQNPASRITLALYALPTHEYLTTVREAATARVLHPGLSVPVSLELWGRILLGGTFLNDCVALKAGPYLGARATCLERTGHANEARVLIDSLSRIVADKAPIDSTFDLSLYVGEMALYYGARKDSVLARQWLRQAFAESPTAIDPRLYRAGMFSPSLEAFGDSLTAEAWKRVLQAAQSSPPSP